MHGLGFGVLKVLLDSGIGRIEAKRKHLLMYEMCMRLCENHFYISDMFRRQQMSDACSPN